MRPALVPFALAAAVAFSLAAASCRCDSDRATPVTVRVKNTLSQPIWVDQTEAHLGVELQRSNAGQWETFAESLQCACLACDQVCSCSCDAGTPRARVMKVAGGTSVEREWEGTVEEDGQVTCGSIFGGRACFQPRFPALDEGLRARLCYALGPPLGTPDPGDAGIPVPGAFDPASLQCVSAEFRPVDGVVELSPTAGAGCQTHGDCRQDAGELCFGGACTTGCPATGFPEYGADWQVAVSVTDQGFFTITSSPTTYTGTGTLTDWQINNGTMKLSLSRPASGGGNLIGSVYLTVPAAYFPAVVRGETVSVKVIDASTSKIQNNRAITVRDAAGKLLLAADPAIPAAILGAADTAPFTVAATGEIVGCDLQPCGKRLHFRTAFGGAATDSGAVLELDPGSSSVVAADGLTYKLLNVVNTRPGQFCSS
ncbi:MAG TPA: hypothetical protein VND93_03855, partial [Myxococcales bacterium]|nr:hypothetical protein [Myxococcales bacterium]